MQVREIMTENPGCCTPDTSLQEIAQMMVDKDCGAIPICESERSKKLVGIITDRDIVTRCVAQGKNPLEMNASQCMTKNPATVTPEMSLEDCCHEMENHQVRRIPVIDNNGACCGIVSQADIARQGSDEATGELVETVSQP